MIITRSINQLLVKVPQLPQDLPWGDILISIGAFDTLAKRTAFSTSIVAFTILFHTVAFFAVASLENCLGDLLLVVLAVDFLLLFVVAVLATADPFATDQTHSQAITVVFLAFGVAAVAALAICVHLLETKFNFLTFALDFQFVNGLVRLLFHRIFRL